MTRQHQRLEKTKPLLPEVTTPERLAKQMGWSTRRVRGLARKLGACRILGNRMVLTKEDVDAILDATKPQPFGPPIGVRDILRQNTRLPEVTYEDRLAQRAAKSRRELRPKSKSRLVELGLKAKGK